MTAHRFLTLCLLALAAALLQPLYGDAVGNAADNSPNLAPGSLATYYGSNPTTAKQAAVTSPLPTTLGGLILRVNGVAAPLLYVSPTQINFQIPYETAPGPATFIVATQTEGTHAPYTKAVAPVAVGVFKGAGDYIAAQNQDYSLNNAANPAKPGTAISIYLTGIGQVTNPVATGHPASLTTLSYAIAQPVTASIGGMPAQVLFLGLAPGFTGLAQLVVLVPDLVLGDFGLSLKVAGSTASLSSIAVGQSVTLPPGSGTVPVVQIETPLANAPVAGTITVSGWALNQDSPTGIDPVTSVRVLQNDSFIGYATYGLPRADICAPFPGRPNCPNVGFTYQLAISPYANSGPLKISVLANDSNTPVLTGTASTTVNIMKPVSVSPASATVPVGGSRSFYADRSVYWSQPLYGKLIVGNDPGFPLPASVNAVSALYLAPSLLTGTTDTFTVTDVRDSSQKAVVTISLGVLPSLSITQSHVGNYQRGQTGSATIQVSNAAFARATAGTVTVSVIMPGGITLVSLTGVGWSCLATNCTRNDALAPGASYPPITQVVNVASNEPSLLIFQPSVSGGGSQPASITDTVVVQ